MLATRPLLVSSREGSFIGLPALVQYPFPARESVGAPTPRSYLHRGLAAAVQTRPCQYATGFWHGLALRFSKGPQRLRRRAMRDVAEQSPPSKRCRASSHSFRLFGRILWPPKEAPHHYTARFGHFPTCPNLAQRRGNTPGMTSPNKAMSGLLPAMRGQYFYSAPAHSSPMGHTRARLRTALLKPCSAGVGWTIGK